MRQSIGDTLLTWIDTYFGVYEDEKGIHVQDTLLDQEIERILFYNEFILILAPGEKKYYPAQSFKKRLKTWALYRSLLYNNDKKDKDGNPGGDNKRHGIEYFRISKN